jgi:hypothetical protein
MDVATAHRTPAASDGAGVQGEQEDAAARGGGPERSEGRAGGGEHGAGWLRRVQFQRAELDSRRRCLSPSAMSAARGHGVAGPSVRLCIRCGLVSFLTVRCLIRRTSGTYGVDGK